MMRLFRPVIVQFLLLAPTVQVALATVTRQECENQGGQVVGDIGDGAIFGPNYICENSGEPPSDVVVAAAGEPIATDGEVCCGGMSPTAMTGADCQAQDGVVVEDALDCNGFPPIGTVVSATGRESGAVGQLCCPSNTTGVPSDGLPISDTASREEISREDCVQEYNGVIVGDIGDGAIFEADYLCDTNGLAPIADITQDFSTGNAAIEGEVCCGVEIGDAMDTLPEDVAERDVITRQECEEQGGEIVGDIGDGSTMMSDYICESSNEAPIANIAQEDPIAIEGEVCCATGTSGAASIAYPQASYVFMISLFVCINACVMCM